MEHVGEIPQGDWNGIVCSDEEAEFMAQLLGNCTLPNESNFVASLPATWPANRSVAVVDEAAMYSSAETMCSFSGFDNFPFSSQESYYSTLCHHAALPNNSLMTMDYCTNDFLNRDASNDSTESKNHVEQGKKEKVVITGKREENISESKKRSRVPCQIPRSKKSMKCSRCPKVDDSDEDNNNNAVRHRQQTSSSCCSEDESTEMIRTTSCSSSKGGRAPNPNAKTRASRGSATDPQSLYARKRRERINERLRILQTLVPNGTKVDISTMLEEAVEYVKFLQLQIKLLSSDDLWMYAPIAYNGMDIGLDLRPQSS